MTRCCSRAAWSAWLLALCVAQAAICGGATALPAAQQKQQELGSSIDTQQQQLLGQQHRSLLQQQQAGQLGELAQAAGSSDSTPLSRSLSQQTSRPQEVVIVDNSPAARSTRRRRGRINANGEEEIVVYPRPQAMRPPTARPPTPTPAAVEPMAGPYCIPRRISRNAFNVLAIGDSITQGAVPSKNINHPYTIRLKEALEPQLGLPVRAVDAGLGGGGVFMTGFNVPVTFGPWVDTYLGQGPWNVVVMMIGINDLLRGGKPADDIMNNLKPMIEKVVATNTPVFLLPPFAAPGFVQESDSKEGERQKLAKLLRSYSQQHAARTKGQGTQVWTLDLEAYPFNFYPMSQSERSKWLDDGLHLTELAYDTVGQLVAQEIARRTCSGPATVMAADSRS